MRYAEQLALLHKGITRKEAEAALPLIKHTRAELSAQTRLAVYADGYIERLAEITLADYPAIQHLMGEQRAQGAARAYALETIPTQWDANQYSVGFADFLAREVPDETGVVALAQLESAVAACFWAEESAPFTAEQLDEASLPSAMFRARTASQLLHLHADAESYLQAFRANAAPQGVPQDVSYIYVLRHENQVKRHSLEPLEYALLSALFKGAPFGEALAASEEQELLAERLPHYLSRWLSEGFFTAKL